MLGWKVDDLRQVPSFAGNQVFKVHYLDRIAFLKLAVDPDAHSDLPREVAVLEALARHGIAAPRIEAYDPACELAGVPCVLLADVGGSPLTGTEPEFHAVGAYLRAVHDIALDGFGTITTTMRGEDQSWTETIRRRTSGLGPAVEAGLVSAELVARVAAAIDARRGLIDAVGAGRMLHGDFTPRHVYSVDGQITGIIDWGDATSGDPAYDLGRILHAGLLAADLAHGLALVDVVIDSYGDAPYLRGDLTSKLLMYAAVFVMWSMEGEFSGGSPWPPWWPAQSRTLALILDALDRPY